MLFFTGFFALRPIISSTSRIRYLRQNSAYIMDTAPMYSTDASWTQLSRLSTGASRRRPNSVRKQRSHDDSRGVKTYTDT